MSLSHELAALTTKPVKPDLLVRWVLKNRARLIDALEMDELTFVPPRLDQVGRKAAR